MVKSIKVIDNNRFLVSQGMSDMCVWSLESKALIYRLEFGCQRFMAQNPGNQFEVAYSHLSSLIKFDIRRPHQENLA